MDDFDFDGGDLPETPATSSGTAGSEDTNSPAHSAAMDGGKSGGRYADELATETVQARFRTFYIDLKQSINGKFLKISEKRNGRKSTIMMDAEDVKPFIEALQKIQSQM